MINANKQRKTIKQERIEISSRKLQIPREYFMQNEHNKSPKEDKKREKQAKNRVDKQKINSKIIH